MTKQSIGLDRLPGIFLAFMIGLYIAWKGLFPFDPWLRTGFLGLEALIAQAKQQVFSAATDVWTEADDTALSGVTVFDADRAYLGETLVTVGQSARLIDMEGSETHSWTFDMHAESDDADAVAISGDGRRIYWQRAHVFPNGDLLALVNQTNVSPDGVAVLKLNKDSQVLWVRHGNYHHDFDIDERGMIYVLDQQIREAPPENLSNMEGPLLDEGLTILLPDGSVHKRISLTDAFSISPYAALVDRSVRPNLYHWGDYLHSNNVDVAGTDTASAFAFVEAGQVLISLREVGVLAVLDVAAEKITWATRGSWSMQHDPDFLANGHMLLFDNQGDWERGGTTRVVELDPGTGRIVWQYPGPHDRPLWSRIRGNSQLLPNGNVLINEFGQRRLLEVTREGEVVWEYHCPYRYEASPELICLAMSSRRYALSELGFTIPVGVLRPSITTRSSSEIAEVTQ